MRKNLINLGEAGFQQLAAEIVKNLNPLLRNHKGATPWFVGVQRFSITEAIPFVDARIEFDLRTAIPSVGPTKTQPRWLPAAYGAFVHKGGSEHEIQMGVVNASIAAPSFGMPMRLISSQRRGLRASPLVDLAR